ncbi:MAG TPA: hypothetical protein VMW75_02490 [Thermoanaerobaculia bacterium]|nr:hypothetical protein [Thermoanaerobaculia bacterium]
MKSSTQRQPTRTLPDPRLPLAGIARAATAGLAPETGGRRDQARSRRSGPPHAPAPHVSTDEFGRDRGSLWLNAGRTVLAVLSAWTAERTGIDPAYLGVLLLASVELGVQRMLGK